MTTSDRLRGSTRNLKVVVTGPFAAGKTTFIEALSEIPVLSTERDVTDDGRATKQRTTVAMDFGRITVADDLALHLFGTPGQSRFDFMWEILAEGMLGFVLLVDGGDEGSIDEAARMLGFFTDVAEVPFVVGVNKLGPCGDGRLPAIRHRLGVADHIEVLAIDARDRSSAKRALLSLLGLVLGTLRGRTPRRAVVGEVG